jgi:uncharacterized protein YlxP (DUF503 family)
LRHTRVPEPTVVVAIVRASLLVPGCRSRKEKRSVVKGLIERSKHKFNASISEVGGHDLLQRAEIAASFVANDHKFVSKEADAFLDYVRGCPDARLVSHDVELL